eukprot:scaffold4940_cov163-Amphora_coffeaeformis.AAC.1
MTGINLTGVKRPTKDITPAQSYPTFHKPAAERFTLLQLGVCLFLSEQGRWKVRRYNFYMFPDSTTNPRDIVLSAETARFLRAHNLSLDTCIEQGLPFQTLEKTQELLQKHANEQNRCEKNRTRNSQRKSSSPRKKTLLTLNRQEDKDFIGKCLDMVAQWRIQCQQSKESNSSILLPECNSFLRRVLYEQVRLEYPHLDLEPAGDSRPNQIRVWQAGTPLSQRETASRQEDWEHFMAETIGVTRIVAALHHACSSTITSELDRTSILFAPSAGHVDWTQTGLTPLAKPPLTQHPIPLIVHHGFMDLLFLMTHFVTATLPTGLSECKILIHKHFSCIFDTKVLAAERSTTYNDPNSSLGDSFDRITADQNILQYVDDDDDGVQFHEAAYDAYMTGLCFLGLCHDIQRNTGLKCVPSLSLGDGKLFYPLLDGSSEASTQLVRHVFAQNCLYHNSIYTIDLENAGVDRMQQGLFLESTFRISDVDPSISPRSLADEVKKDYTSQQYGLDTHRVGEGIFLVTINFNGDPCKSSTANFLSTVREQGSKLEKALRSKFSVARLDGYLVDDSATSGVDQSGPWLVQFLASWLGFFPWTFSPDKSSYNQRKCSIRNDITLDPEIVREWKDAVM